MDFEKELRKKKLKITPQRLAILREIHENGHVGISDIYGKLRLHHPYISLATVYKNVSILYEANILREVITVGNKRLYEIRGEHIHVMCEKCYKIEDIEVSIDHFRDSCENASGYKLSRISAMLSGVCSTCLVEHTANTDSSERLTFQ